MKRPSRGIALLWSVALSLLLLGATSEARTSGHASESGRAVEMLPDPAAGAPRASVDGAEVSSGGASAEVVTPTSRAPVGEGEQVSLTGAPQGDTPFTARVRSLLGLVLLMVIAGLLSTRRGSIPWRIVLWGVGLQLLFGIFILKTPVGEEIFSAVNEVVVALLGFTVEGARFVFGDLVFNTVPVGSGTPGTNLPMTPAGDTVARTGAFFAFNVLPTIIFFSSLMTVLYHIGIMQVVVKGVAWVMTKTMRTSGAETLSAAGNIFVGQTEAPLLIKPFVDRMTMSELMAVMTGGFATVAGGVLAAYVGMLVGVFPDIAGHLMAASVMSAPAALVIAKLMVPEEGEPETAGSLAVSVEKPDVNVIDAAARGASEGLGLALNVGAMLMAFLAIVYLLNAMIGWGGGLVGVEGLTMESILGWVLAPLAWMMGVEWADAPVVASLMGVKTVLNEFVAYLQLSNVMAEPAALSARSAVIATYALSGFANFSSIAIQLGGIGGIAPNRRHDLSRLGMRAMIGGSLAAFMTAAVAGMLV